MKFSIPPVFKNRYLITLMAFLIWMTFFDNNNFVRQIKSKQEIKAAEAQIIWHKQQLLEVKHDLDELFTSNETLERFARENYHMKRENEDIYLIVNGN